ncbi:MAG TPA: hypothetical protein VGS41_11730, partial [Chthonomonadales bacterium]|nr:hypothetical protein [Chthonomonadales bacterium]
DLNDPDTLQKIRIAVASRRCVPWQQYLAHLWSTARFVSDNPTDREVIESYLFPTRAQIEVGGK